MEDPKLMDYFEFDEGDLQANRFGQFTSKQLERLKEETETEKKGGIGCGAIFFLIALGGIVGAILAGLSNQEWGSRIGIGLSFGCLWPIVWGSIGWMIMSGSFKKTEFKIAKVQGRINIVRDESYNSNTHATHETYEMHIGGETFEVDEGLADVMMQGDEYIVYYLEDTEKIISAEFIKKA